MNQDVIKFEELMKTDPEIQQKLREAAEKYDGNSEDIKAVFEQIILPIANEKGLNATFEEFRDYVYPSIAEDGEISEDELEQIAGGKKSMTDTFALKLCLGVGIGVSYGDDETLCVVLGGGRAGACLGEGVGLG